MTPSPSTSYSLTEKPSINTFFEEDIEKLDQDIQKLFSTINSNRSINFNPELKNKIHDICQLHLENLKDIFALHIDLDKPQESKDNLEKIKELFNKIATISNSIGKDINSQKFNDDLKNIIQQKQSSLNYNPNFSRIEEWLKNPNNIFNSSPDDDFKNPYQITEISPCQTEMSRLPTASNINLPILQSENLIYDTKRNFYVLYKGDNERASHFESIKDIADNFTEYFNSLNKEDRRFLMGKRIQPWTDPYSHKISYTDDIFENESGARFIELEFYDKFKCKQLIRMEVLLDEIKSYKTFEHLSSGYVETREKNFELQFVPPILPTTYYSQPQYSTSHYSSPVNSNFTPYIPLFQSPYQPIQQQIFHPSLHPSYQPLILSSMSTLIQNPNTTIIPSTRNLTQLSQLYR